MVDKIYCMSSYLTLRFIVCEEMNFYDGLHHKKFVPLADNLKKPIFHAEDIDRYIKDSVSKVKGKKGLLLSGGMDSAILASYMVGGDAYTFRFCGGVYQKDELQRAEYYADYYGLKLHYVDIDWHTVERYLDKCMIEKGAPVHSIEPQIVQAALQAKSDGIEMMVTGAISDLTFGGMDKLLAKDWEFHEFIERYTFLNPQNVLEKSINMNHVFENYRITDNKIDFLEFMKGISYVECCASYQNAFQVANIPYLDPYAELKMAEPLDLERIRNGESKYLIRELFSIKYPGIPIPDKIPMPRPVDIYFKNWKGPKRHEFKKNLDMDTFTGNQKWQMYCLERFLNLYES